MFRYIDVINQNIIQIYYINNIHQIDKNFINIYLKCNRNIN